MPRRWIIRPLAESDLNDAAAWYDHQRAGLGLRFLDTVDQLFERIRVSPLQFPSISSDVRRALLHTFPYAVAYLHLSHETGEKSAKTVPSADGLLVVDYAANGQPSGVEITAPLAVSLCCKAIAAPKPVEDPVK